MNRIKFLLLIIVFPLSSFAFLADTAKKVYSSNVVRWLQQVDTHADTLTLHSLDTTADRFQNFNPIFSNVNDNARIYLGNLGLATKSIAFQETTSWGFDLGRHSFDPYLKQIDDLKFYRTLSPYTNLYYIWNRKKEQLFQFEFSQNIGPRFNYAVNFTRMVSVGDYGRQESDHLNYDVNSWYTSKNRRYQVFVALINSSLVLQENGGIKSDSIFKVSSTINSEFEPVYLNNASNRISDKHYFLKQTYAFGPKDTLKLDTMKIERIRPKYRVYHEVRYNVRKDNYKETPLDSGVYAAILYDSTNTADEILVKHLQNRVGVELYSKSRRSRRMNYTTYYLRYDAINYINLNFDTTLNGLSIFSERTTQITKRLEWKLKLSNGLMGNFDDNRVIQSYFNLYSTNDSSVWQLELRHRNNDPSLFSERYTSNHYEWTNDFTNVVSNSVHFKYAHLKSKFSTTLTLGSVGKEVYFDTAMIAHQLANYKYVQIQIQKLIRVGKFYLNNQLFLQGSNHNDIKRMPLLHTYQSLYFQSYVFKKAMNIRTGFDVRYYTKTKSFDYNPATSQFYLSNKSLGDYPIIDFFLTASIKRAVLMMKIDHLNQGFWNKGYYMVDGYPLPDRVLKIGLRWAFYD